MGKSGCTDVQRTTSSYWHTVSSRSDQRRKFSTWFDQRTATTTFKMRTWLLLVLCTLLAAYQIDSTKVKDAPKDVKVAEDEDAIEEAFDENNDDISDELMMKTIDKIIEKSDEYENDEEEEEDEDVKADDADPKGEQANTLVEKVTTEVKKPKKEKEGGKGKGKGEKAKFFWRRRRRRRRRNLVGKIVKGVCCWKG